MCQHAALDEDALLLVEHGAQEVVGVQRTLHKHVGAAFAHLFHGMTRRIVGVAGYDEGHLVWIVGSQTASDVSLSCVSHKDEACELLRNASFDNFFCVRVGRRCHGNRHYLRSLAQTFG